MSAYRPTFKAKSLDLGSGWVIALFPWRRKFTLGVSQTHHSKNTGGTNVHLNEDCCQLETTTNIYFNPLTPMNDQDRISHHNIYTISTR